MVTEVAMGLSLYPSINKSAKDLLVPVPSFIFLPAKAPVYSERSVKDELKKHLGFICGEACMRHKIRDNFIMLMSGNPLDDMVADRYVHKQVMIFIRISDPLAGGQDGFILTEHI